MRGVAVLLADFEGKVEVFWAKEKSATKTIEKLGDMIGKGWNSILLMFPAFYFPGKFEFLRFFFNDKKYYRSFVKNKDNSKGIKALESYSKYLDNKKMLYPINKTLKIISEKTGKNTPVIGMNLIPLEAASYTPLILANYKNVNNGAAAMCFKGRINAIFHDVFPERGSTYEETFEIIKNYFPGTEKVRVTKALTAIGEVNGFKPVDFLRMKKAGLQDVNQDEFLRNVEDGKQLMVSPYSLMFISRKTHGGTTLGLINSPLSIYPCLFNLNDYYDVVAFVGEVYRGGVKTFGKILEKKKLYGFDLCVLDSSVIMSFGGDVHKLIDIVKEKSKSFFGIFSAPPSAYIPVIDRKYISETENRICFNLTGTSAVMEFK
jgi:hypothetical protein